MAKCQLLWARQAACGINSCTLCLCHARLGRRHSFAWHTAALADKRMDRAPAIRRRDAAGASTHRGRGQAMRPVAAVCQQGHVCLVAPSSAQALDADAPWRVRAQLCSGHGIVQAGRGRTWAQLARVQAAGPAPQAPDAAKWPAVAGARLVQAWALVWPPA